MAYDLVVSFVKLQKKNPLIWIFQTLACYYELFFKGFVVKKNS